jgi:hypothetical protein
MASELSSMPNPPIGVLRRKSRADPSVDFKFSELPVHFHERTGTGKNWSQYPFRSTSFETNFKRENIYVEYLKSDLMLEILWGPHTSHK